jgi:hypothetical protein
MLHTSPKQLPMSDIHAYFGEKSLVRNLMKMKTHNILCIKFFWEIIFRKKLDITFFWKMAALSYVRPPNKRLVSTTSNLYVH